jgi:hypothetical protein
MRINLEKLKDLSVKPKVVYLVIGFILLLGIAIFAISHYIKEQQALIYDVEITNISGGTATITWVTNTEVKGFVYYGEDDTFSPFLPFLFKNVEYDDRDVELVEVNTEEVISEDGLQFRYTHHVTLEGLDPETTYYYRISNNGVWGRDRSSADKALVPFKTDPVYNNLVAPEPVYGKAIDVNGDPAGDALVKVVLVREDGVLSKTVSAVTNESGGYSLDVGNIAYLFPELFGLSPEELIENNKFKHELVQVITGTDVKSELRVIPLDQDQPVETLVVGKQ